MLRSCLYQIYLLISAILILAIFSLPALLNRKSAKLICLIWAKNCIIGAEYILGIKARVSGIPSSHPVIYASKHQSVWETAFLQTIIRSPVFILKKELAGLPVLGFFIKRAGHVAVDRRHGFKMLKPMVEAVLQAVDSGNNVIIFPEGTRSLPGEKLRYKKGIAYLYQNLPEIDIIPVSLNSGRLWPRRSLRKKPGFIDVIFHPQMPKNLSREQFMSQLEKHIEALN